MTSIKILALAVCTLTLFSFPHDIVGHWTSNGPNNSKIYVDFNANGTFKVTVDGNTENEGTYKFRNDSFYMSDKGCGQNIQGLYKINFYTKDSASFVLLSDSCKDRASEVNGGVIVRIK